MCLCTPAMYKGQACAHAQGGPNRRGVGRILPMRATPPHGVLPHVLQNLARNVVWMDSSTLRYLRTFLPLQWDSAEQLLADAVADGVNKRFVQFFLELRVHHRYRHKWEHLEAVVRGDERTPR